MIGLARRLAGQLGRSRPAHANDRLVLDHLARRLPEIQRQLDIARPEFVFLAGNSHAELVGDALGRHRPVVNGGIGATSARGYALQHDRLTFRSRAGAAVLFLGTNDIMRGGRPDLPATHAKFAAFVRRSVTWLQAHADQVLVAAVPPIGAAATDLRDPAAVAVYSVNLAALCDRQDCRFIDPFAALRDGPGGLSTQLEPADGVHLRDYAALAAALVPDLTPHLASSVSTLAGVRGC